MVNQVQEAMAASKQRGPADPNMVFAELDFAQRDNLRIGGGVQEERPIINWAQLVAARARRPSAIRRYFIVMWGPRGKGDGPYRMPAEKAQKWWGQGYRPVDWVYKPPPFPRRWVPSMIEDAIDKGIPIPAEMAPDGYGGPVFRIKRREYELSPEEATPERMQRMVDESQRAMRGEPDVELPPEPGNSFEEAVAMGQDDLRSIGLDDIAGLGGVAVGQVRSDPRSEFDADLADDDPDSSLEPSAQSPDDAPAGSGDDEQGTEERA